MPAPFSEYSLLDWLHFKPIVHRYKHARFCARYAWLVRRPSVAGEVAAVVAKSAGRKLLTTIAFNDPAKAQIQTRAVSKFVPGCIHLIADNSTDDVRAALIETAAHEHGALYLRLPRGPWTGRNAGLSHGLGMTWVWRNIVRPGKPYAIGFIDHDIYPTEPDDPFIPLADYPIAGRVWRRPPRWHLWAGFCFFRYDAFSKVRMNFIRDWFAGLDTGGGNWRPVYRYLDYSRVCDPGVRRVAILPGVDADTCAIEWIGTWLHEHNDWRHLDGVQERDFMREKTAHVSERMSRLLREAE